MKKFLKVFITVLIIVLSFASISTAASVSFVTSVAVNGIEAPYSESSVLDTKGEVLRGSPYRITNVAWATPKSSQSGFYEVTITLKPNIGYKFSGDVTGTVNGENIIAKRLINEEELNITYAFDENSSTSSTINNATSSIRYRISVYCDKEQGSITPVISRVLEGKNETFTITPKEGYKIKDVVVDGESVGAVTEYTFKRVEENHDIRAYFEKVPENKEIKPILSTLISIIKSII